MLRVWNKSSERRHFSSTSFSTQKDPCLQTSHCTIHWHCVLLWTKIFSAFQASFFSAVLDCCGALVLAMPPGKPRDIVNSLLHPKSLFSSPWKFVRKGCKNCELHWTYAGHSRFSIDLLKIWATKTGCSGSTRMLQTNPCRVTSLRQRYRWQHLTQDLCTAGWPLIWALI